MRLIRLSVLIVLLLMCVVLDISHVSSIRQHGWPPDPYLYDVGGGRFSIGTSTLLEKVIYAGTEAVFVALQVWIVIALIRSAKIRQEG